MTYWLDLFTPYTWGRFQDHGAKVSGFRPRQRKTAFGRVKQGEKFLCYLVKLSRWCGVLTVESDAFEDTAPIFADVNDPFPIRFKVIPDVLLDFEHAIPIETPQLWSKLSFTRTLTVGAFGWAQAAGLRQSLFEISATDGGLIHKALQEQSIVKKRYEFDAADRRHIAQRMVVRTQTGEIEVEVPEREEVRKHEETAPPIEVDQEIKASIKMQAKSRTTWRRLSVSIFGSRLPIGAEFLRLCPINILIN